MLTQSTADSLKERMRVVTTKFLQGTVFLDFFVFMVSAVLESKCENALLTKPIGKL